MPKIRIFYQKAFYFAVVVAIAITIFLLQKSNIQLHPWLNNYLNDFLCMPIVLSICQRAIKIIKSNYSFRLPLPLILFTTMGYSYYFEYYLPSVNNRYTADTVDIFLYFFGSACFYLIELHSFRLSKGHRQ